MAEYGIWLSFNNRAEEFQIPVNPEQIEISDGGRGQTYDLIGLGEINVIKARKLTEYGWSSVFPARRYPWVAVDQLQTPAAYVQSLQRWRESMRPLRFVFAGDTFGLNAPVSIESFTWKEIAGSGGDIEYTIRLKEYKFYGAQRVQVVPGSALAVPAGVPGLQTPEQSPTVLQVQPPPRPDDRQVPATYTLASGDTLWMVAQRCLGDGARWPEIQRLNNISDAEIKTLQVGRALRLPGGGSGVA
jgi:hypothetical protein